MMSALFLSKTLSHRKNISDRMMIFFNKYMRHFYDGQLKEKIMLWWNAVGITSLQCFYFFKNGWRIYSNISKKVILLFTAYYRREHRLSQSIETSMQASRLIKEFDEVKMVVGKTGSAEVPTDPMPPEASDMMIILKPKANGSDNIRL
jgi:cobalt-zinc-cadmium resistance protein CzcA